MYQQKQGNETMYSFILTVYDMTFALDFGLTIDDCKILIQQWTPTIEAPAFVSCDIEFIESNLIDRVKKKGLPIITWTVDNEDKKKKANLIADNIIFENIRP